jgi:Fe2+ transport system protein FeoA
MSDPAFEAIRRRQFAALQARVEAALPLYRLPGAPAMQALSEPAAAGAPQLPLRPPGEPLLSGFPGPLEYAWVKIWSFAGGSPEQQARLRVRGYRATNRGVATKASFDKTWKLFTIGLTSGEILDIVAEMLEADPVGMRCRRDEHDPLLLRVSASSFALRIDGIVVSP